MKLKLQLILVAIATACGAQNASADVLATNATTNNGGSANWALFSDFTALSSSITITDMTTFSNATAGGAFTVEIFTRTGSGLGGPVGNGPGSSSAGWTSLGIANATQGGTASGESLLIDIPDIFVGSGNTVGVAFLFGIAGPRYFGIGTPPIQNFSDAFLSINTGDSRTAPFTTGGSFFSSRGHAGSFTYSVVPEPATASLALFGLALVGLRRRK